MSKFKKLQYFIIVSELGEDCPNSYFEIVCFEIPIFSAKAVTVYPLAKRASFNFSGIILLVTW